MSSTQFLHTAQFFQTIFCFSLLVLIGQQFLLIWRQLDEKFMGMKVKEYNEEQQWLREKMNVVVQASNGENQNKRQQQGHEKQAKPPKQQTLRSSLVGNEHDQTDRKMYQQNHQQTYKDTRRKSMDSDYNNNNLNKRKSLTDLRKQQLKNQKQQQSQQQKQQQKQQQLRQIEIKDESDATVSRKQSIDSQIIQPKNKNRRSSQLSSASAKLQKKLQQQQEKQQQQHFNQPNYKQQQDQPSVVNSNYSDHQNEEMRTQIKTSFKLQVLRQIDIVFGQHLAILMPLLILGIVVHSTYIFTIVCFFGYGFSHLLVNYTGNNVGGVQNSLFSRNKLGKLVPKLCIVAIFISYWADKQFS